jgi:hypothetical protein
VKGARYEDGEETVWPSPFGAHSWHAMSYNPNTGLVYIPAIEMAGVFKDKGMDLGKWQSPHFYIDPGVVFGGEDTPKDIQHGIAVGLGSDQAEEGLAAAAATDVERRHHDHQGQPGVRRARRR